MQYSGKINREHFNLDCLSSSYIVLHRNNILALRLVTRKLQDQSKLETVHCIYFIVTIEQSHLLPAFEDLCPDGSFAQSLKSIPKGQTLSTQNDGMDQVLKKPRLPVRGAHGRMTISVSCHD